jgi:hypothetical protein
VDGEKGRNDPNIACTFEYNKKRKKKAFLSFHLYLRVSMRGCSLILQFHND